MPGPAHEMMVKVLKEHPQWFNLLLKALKHRPLSKGLELADTALQAVLTIERRPDVFWLKPGESWALAEVQTEWKAEKVASWIVTMAMLVAEHKVMGDLFLVTADRATAEHARHEITLTAQHGTSLRLQPVVVLLTAKEARALLATKRPELAFFAAWAVRHRHGPAAKAIVREALELTDAAEDARLRAAQVQAILNVLEPPLLQMFKETLVNLDTMPESEAFRELRLFLEARAEARGEARGEARMLLQALTLRGFTVADPLRERVMTCTDHALIERWFERAMKAPTLDEVFTDDAR